MMAQIAECNYIILASSAGADSPRPVAVVVQADSGRETEEYGFYFRKLPKGAPGSEVSYLNQLFRSWKDLPRADRSALFEELGDLSSEPLFAQEVNSCSAKDVLKIASEALGLTDAFEGPLRSLDDQEIVS